MAELRYAYRDGDDPDAMRDALRTAGVNLRDDTDIDGVTRLVVVDVDDRERVRELLRTARPPGQQRHSVLFEEELAGGA